MQVQFWAEYKRVILGVRKCNFGLDKRVIEEIGQQLALTSSPHLAAADTSRSYHQFASRYIAISLHFGDYILIERWISSKKGSTKSANGR